MVLGVSEDDAVVVLLVVVLVFPGTDLPDVKVSTGEAVVAVTAVVSATGSHADAIIPNCEDTVGRDSRYDINGGGSSSPVAVWISG